MPSAATQHSLRHRFVVLSTLLFLGVLLVGCGTRPSGPGITGSWSSEIGSVDFSARTSPFPYTYDSHAGSPGGGLIVDEASGGYAVTLVSSDGSRSTASKTSVHNAALLVDLPAGQLQLTRQSADRLLMLQAENGIPAPGSGVYLRPGTP